MLRGVKRGMPLFEEQEMAKEMYHRLSNLSLECHWVARYLAGAYPENRLCARGREEMLRVHEYSKLVVDALAAYYEILCTVVKAIRCDSTSFDSFCADLITRYDALQRSLDHTITSGAQLLNTLADFKQYVVGKFSYPPFTHFVVMNILGPSWTPREKAFSIVPPKIQEMSEEVEAGVALAARLRVSVSGLREQLSITKLREARSLDEEARHKLAVLVDDAAYALCSCTSSARNAARRIGDFVSLSTYMPLYPEQEMARGMCGEINRIDFACHWVGQFLAGAYPDNKLCSRGQEEMRHLHVYANLIVNALAAFHDILSTVVDAILCEPDSFDASSTNLITQYDALQSNLERIITSGGRLLDSLPDFKQYVLDNFCYSSAIRSLVARILGPTWTPREKAFFYVPPRIQEIWDEVVSIVALAARLEESVAGLRERFSMAKLTETRELDAEARHALGMLVDDAAFAIYSYGTSRPFIYELTRRRCTPEVVWIHDATGRDKPTASWGKQVTTGQASAFGRRPAETPLYFHHWHMPLYEEQEMAGEMYGQLSHLSSDCHWVVRYLAGAYPEHRLCPRGLEEMYRLHEYSKLTGDALAAYYEVLCTVVDAIRCEPASFNSTSADLIDRYDTLQLSLDHVITSGGQLLGSLADFKQYVVDKFSYPPIIHFLVMNILGPRWTPRETAFSVVPPKIQEISEKVETGVALAARLKASVAGLREHFSMTKLMEARELDEEARHNLAMLVADAAFALCSYTSSARTTADRVGNFASPHTIIP
ncbi:hypothetical protein K523DRAFT_364726 [Schizophyllum commune Tattone D]|nr:hypothetical protein K523DRAFT_364726 [Schizophyllum commune Tattone D]